MQQIPLELKTQCLSSLLSALIIFQSSNTYAQLAISPTRPRIVVTADPELDDNNSLIRFLLYSTDLEIEGLIYASSQYHWKGDGKGTRWFVPGREHDRFGMDLCPCTSWRWAEDEQFIHDAVEAYGKVYKNLKTHNPNYPSPEYLKSKIRFGNVEFDGDFSKDTPGSDLIQSLILDNRPGQLFITAWGGQSTIARALKSIQDRYEFTTQWAAVKSKVSRKVVLLPSGDQDDTYALYIKPHWPEIEYRQFEGPPYYGYFAHKKASTEEAQFLTPTWMNRHVSRRGPLGSLYRVWGDGKQMVEGDKLDYFGLSGHTDEELKEMGYRVWAPVQAKGSWLAETDSITFMNMIGNGLRGHEKGGYGGWGGRIVEKRSFNRVHPFPSFFPHVQRDFANRLKWSVTANYSDANHEPEVRILGPLNLLASPGQVLKLHGTVSDPDQNTVSVKWWQFHDAGSYPGTVQISDSTSLRPEILIGEDAVAGQSIHLILEATDDGKPSLTRYRRVIITVKNK